MILIHYLNFKGLILNGEQAELSKNAVGAC